MLLKLMIEDSRLLQQKGRYLSALTLALICVDAAGKLTTKEEVVGKRFRDFLKTGSSLFNIGHVIDAPQAPETPEPPPFDPPELDGGATEAQVLEYMTYIAKFCENQKQWWQRWEEQLKRINSSLLDAGDDYWGGRKRKYSGVPRRVTTAGVLYAVRCELVHEGNLSIVEVIPPSEPSVLTITGGTPVRMSANWIEIILEAVERACL